MISLTSYWNLKFDISNIASVNKAVQLWKALTYIIQPVKENTTFRSLRNIYSYPISSFWSGGNKPESANYSQNIFLSIFVFF